MKLLWLYTETNWIWEFSWNPYIYIYTDEYFMGQNKYQAQISQWQIKENEP